MRGNHHRPVGAPAPDTPQESDPPELEALRTTCWRQAHEIQSLDDTISVLRAGANALAIDNAGLRAAITSLQTDELSEDGAAARAPERLSRVSRRRHCPPGAHRR